MEPSERQPARRVYVRRRSRTTAAQARGLQRLPEFLLDSKAIDHAFGREGKILVEIGFGNGGALAEFAAANPDWNCVGVEVFRAGIGALINQCLAHDLSNVKIVDGEGLTFLESLDDASIDMVWTLFPDPWPKARHHKRRLVTNSFATVVEQKLKDGGELHIATDWQEYAEQIAEVLRAADRLHGGKMDASALRSATKYERRGVRLGHTVSDFVFVKNDTS